MYKLGQIVDLPWRYGVKVRGVSADGTRVQIMYYDCQTGENVRQWVDSEVLR
jgi:hypothetical protein